MKKKVVVGMSGGVDSSVAAYLLKAEGYDVIGVTMQIWQDNEEECSLENGGCCGLSAVNDARSVADILDIPFYVMNFKDDFKKNVIAYFIDEYMMGRTPNPCIACNRYVKWESFLKKALDIGADYIATGHYAQVTKHPNTGRITLKRVVLDGKDQSYALYNLTQGQLERTLMPVGAYPKNEIRDIAAKIGLSVANKPDSQEICFIPDNDYGNFIKKNVDTDFSIGNFLDIDGNILGKHKGIFHYTIGQRKGLGVAFGKPMYVKKIDKNKNAVILADDKQIFEKELVAEKINFMAYENLEQPLIAEAKIRYSHKLGKCQAYVKDNKLYVEFQEPQRAITPGQAVVIYKDDYIICGGVIL